MDEQEFRGLSDRALTALKQQLIAAEDTGDYEAEEQNGVLTVGFDTPPGKFVITPNTPVRQIWISALSTSFKLDWDESESAFVYPRTREDMRTLVGRLIAEHTGEEDFRL